MMNVRQSESGRYGESLPRGSEVWGDQVMWGKSNAEVSDAKSKMLDSYLVLGKASPHSSLKCLDISLTETTLSVGKDKFLTKLCSLLALRINISGSNIS